MRPKDRGVLLASLVLSYPCQATASLADASLDPLSPESSSLMGMRHTFGWELFSPSIAN